MSTLIDPLFAKAKNRRERNVIRNDARTLGKRKVLSIGPVFEAAVLGDLEHPYRELFKRFNQAYVFTAQHYNQERRSVECDPYWFHRTYRNNWRLKLKRLWVRIKRALDRLPPPAASPAP